MAAGGERRDMYLNESIAHYLERCKKQIDSLENKISELPEGELQIHKNRNYCMWRVSYGKGGRITLTKDQEEKASQLALKKLYAAQLHDVRNETEACARYLRCKERSYSAVERLLADEPPEYRRLLGRSLITTDERVRAWETAEYRKSQKYPEQLKYSTLKPDEFVRSKLEALFAVDLTTLRIPYLYEKIIAANGIEIAADFTALDVRTFQEIPVELFGMMDDPEYRQMYKRKMKTYLDAGYIPGVNMLTFYETSAAPLNHVQAQEDLENFFYKRPPVML